MKIKSSVYDNQQLLAMLRFKTIWWRHQMETFSALLTLWMGNSLVTGEFPSQRTVTLSFDVFFDLCLNKWLNKPLTCQWFETPSCSLWRHSNNFGCNATEESLRSAMYQPQNYNHVISTHSSCKAASLQSKNSVKVWMLCFNQKFCKCDIWGSTMGVIHRCRWGHTVSISR